MALTITNKINGVFGNKRVTFANIAFDSSYAFGGETLVAGSLGLSAIGRVEIMPQAGLSFEYDYTNEKLKAFAPAPPMVIEEKHTIAAATITLDYPVAALLNITSASVHQALIDPSATLAASECQLSAAITAGARSSITFEASTTGVVYVTYITQAWKDIWDNRTASEVAATANHVATLANNAVFIESVHGSHATSDLNIFEAIRGGDTAATGEMEVDFTDASASSDTTLTFVNTDAITGVKATYIAAPASGYIIDRFTEDENVAITSGAGNTAFPILCPSLYGQIPDYTGGGERDSHPAMMLAQDALGTANECYIDWYTRATAAGTPVKVNDTSSDAVSMSYLKGRIEEIPGVVPLEVKNAADLSHLTGIKVMVYGR